MQTQTISHIFNYACHGARCSIQVIRKMIGGIFQLMRINRAYLSSNHRIDRLIKLGVELTGSSAMIHLRRVPLYVGIVGIKMSGLTKTKDYRGFFFQLSHARCHQLSLTSFNLLANSNSHTTAGIKSAAFVTLSLNCFKWRLWNYVNKILF